VLAAGEDITDIDHIVLSARSKLSALPAVDASQASGALHDALVERLRAQIEDQVLARFGLTLESFLSDGKNLLTSRVFDDLVEKIGYVKLPIHFLLVGFDGGGSGHLMAVDGDRSPASYDSVGFLAIGSGSNAATVSLAYQSGQGHYLGVDSGLAECVYCCSEAKFMAESASDVGAGTFMMILKHQREPQCISSVRIDEEIRKAWVTTGAPRIPSKLIKSIPAMAVTLADLTTAEGFHAFVGKGKISRARLDREFKALKMAASRELDSPDPQPPKADQ